MHAGNSDWYAQMLALIMMGIIGVAATSSDSAMPYPSYGMLGHDDVSFRMMREPGIG